MNRNQILSLYRSLLRAAWKFHNYNFREFAKRKVNYEFHKAKGLTDAGSIQQKYDYGVDQLNILKRQVIISSLYPEEASVLDVRKK